MQAAGLSDFGDGAHREGLERLVAALGREADLTPAGEAMLAMRFTGLLVARLGIEDTYARHPEIANEEVEGPILVIGLPRTGTTALSQLIAADPQIRSLRTWESSAPVPPPESDSEHTDPRIAATQAGIDMMNEAFPRMPMLYHSEATTATECQDLLGMTFRTLHFDGMARVPSYTSWARDCDMTPAYQYHRRTLHLLQWHCPPRLWHLKTPVHMFALEALLAIYPNARFIWTHRDPAPVLGSVCDLIHYTRSWASDRDDALELGGEQLDAWGEAVDRAMAFRDRVGDDRFADVSFDDLQVDPVGAFERAYARLGVDVPETTRTAVAAWASAHKPGTRGRHEYDLARFGLTPDKVRRHFTDYLQRFKVPASESE